MTAITFGLQSQRTEHNKTVMKLSIDNAVLAAETSPSLTAAALGQPSMSAYLESSLWQNR
jgi:hypothetical protein